METLTGMGLERVKLGAAQRTCPSLAGYYVVHLAIQAGKDQRQQRNALNEIKAHNPDLVTQKLDNILEGAERFELIGGVLFRRVYDTVAAEVQLRCAIPDQPIGQVEVPGIGQRNLNYRDMLITLYHNGPLAGHVGRDRTLECLERDYWWPRMAEDVRQWCKRCVHCQGERGVPSVSTWTRTELYSRPFRVIQFDTITCRDQHDRAGGANYVLTVIDCFSRWPWLIPLKTREASEIAEGLMLRVFLGEAMFPVVMRSDNAKEFVGSVVQELNKLLGMTHITGSAYHPRSQGMIESMHKTVNHLVRGLVTDHPEDWESRLPFVQAILRIMPLKALNGRSPYEVVTGLKPKLPTALDPGLSVEHLSVDDYCKRLREFFDSCYKDVQKAQLEVAERNLDEAPGLLSKELRVGDIVLVRVPATTRREGPLRFQSRVLPDTYRVCRRIAANTFMVESVVDPGRETSFVQPIHAERLVKLDMPELQLSDRMNRDIEIYDNTRDAWDRFKIEKYSIDGRVQVRKLANPTELEWLDMSTVRYRWVVELGR